MDAITYSAARGNLASVMDRVCSDHEALIITRSGKQAVVVLSLEDFKAMEETAHLLRSPANARRLLTAVVELNAGKGSARTRHRHRKACAAENWGASHTLTPTLSRKGKRGY